jgi:hypothetical protein
MIAYIHVYMELSKITAWLKSNKIIFNKERSRVMLILMRQRKEVKENKAYLNNKHLEQVTTMKYIQIILDNKFRFCEHISYAAEGVQNQSTAYPNRPKYHENSNVKC